MERQSVWRHLVRTRQVGPPGFVSDLYKERARSAPRSFAPYILFREKSPNRAHPWRAKTAMYNRKEKRCVL